MFWFNSRARPPPPPPTLGNVVVTYLLCACDMNTLALNADIRRNRKCEMRDTLATSCRPLAKSNEILAAIEPEHKRSSNKDIITIIYSLYAPLHYCVFTSRRGIWVGLLLISAHTLYFRILSYEFAWWIMNCAKCTAATWYFSLFIWLHTRTAIWSKIYTWVRLVV